MHASQDELKPCQCGGKAGAYQDIMRCHQWCVQCNACGIHTLYYRKRAAAVRVWNKRERIGGYAIEAEILVFAETPSTDRVRCHVTLQGEDHAWFTMVFGVDREIHSCMYELFRPDTVSMRRCAEAYEESVKIAEDLLESYGAAEDKQSMHGVTVKREFFTKETP